MDLHHRFQIEAHNCDRCPALLRQYVAPSTWLTLVERHSLLGLAYDCNLCLVSLSAEALIYHVNLQASLSGVYVRASATSCWTCTDTPKNETLVMYT
jgi:hypothetical protein